MRRLACLLRRHPWEQVDDRMVAHPWLPGVTLWLPGYLACARCGRRVRLDGGMAGRGLDGWLPALGGWLARLPGRLAAYLGWMAGRAQVDGWLPSLGLGLRRLGRMAGLGLRRARCAGAGVLGARVSMARAGRDGERVPYSGRRAARAQDGSHISRDGYR